MTKNSRVASEVFVAGNKVVIGGEVKSNHKLSKADYDNLVKDVLKTLVMTEQAILAKSSVYILMRLMLWCF